MKLGDLGSLGLGKTKVKSTPLLPENMEIRVLGSFGISNKNEVNIFPPPPPPKKWEFGI